MGGNNSSTPLATNQECGRANPATQLRRRAIIILVSVSLVYVGMIITYSTDSYAVEVTRLRMVPETLPDLVRTQLAARRVRLKNRRVELDLKIEEFDKECADVEEGSAKDISCQSTLNSLTNALTLYDADVKKFNRRLSIEELQAAKLQVSIVARVQMKVDRADPKWVNEVQDHTVVAIRLRRNEIEAITHSFKIKEPPPPQLPIRLNQVATGDIILVGPDNSTLIGTAQGFVQGFSEKWLFGNQNGNVTHALVYVGEQSGVKLFLDNQLSEGPRIISETEFKQRYGKRLLYNARPTLQPDGHEMFKSAYEFAKSNMSATKRGHGLLGTRYGIFGKGEVVCSEASLFSVVRAQAIKTGPGKIFTVEYVGGNRLNPISVTPGDIYNQDGKGYFTIQPMQTDG